MQDMQEGSFDGTPENRVLSDLPSQGTQEWFAQRLGKVTASRIADLTTRTKTGWGASRANYAAQLVAERLTGVAVAGFKSPAMEWGTANESDARALYALVKGVDVAQVGFIDHPAISMTGASPDGLVADDGLVELKAPLTATHIDTLLRGAIDKRYILQMQWQMACTGRQWCDFVSYDPRLPAEMQLYVERVPRHDEMIADLETDVTMFLAEVEATVAALQAKYPRAS